MNEIAQRTVMPVKDLADLKTMAAEVVKSGLLPGVKTEQAAFVVAQHVTVTGQTFIEFMARHHVAGDGTVSVKADVQLADMMAAGFKVKWMRFDDEEARANFIDPDGHAVELAFTIQDAEKAGLLKSKNDNWTKRPDAMLRARLISKAKRMLCPGATAGLYNESEVEEIREARRNKGQGSAVKVGPEAAQAVEAVVSTFPGTEVEEVIEPEPEREAVAEEAVIVEDSPAADVSTCPVPGPMYGRVWAEMDKETQQAALTLGNPEMTDAHRSHIKSLLEAK